jgi:hypothetical protein
MIEPYLSDPRPLIEQVLPIIGHCIYAVGRMNYISKMSAVDKQEFIQLYQPQEIAKLWEYVKDQPQVFLKKDTIIDILKLVL